MKSKHLLIAVSLLLAGCGAPPKKPPQAEAAVPPGEMLSIEDFPEGSTKYRILSILRQEWHYFGQQEVVIREEEQSIPHVGVWEDDDGVHSDRVNVYWQAVGMPGLTGYDCDQPWSAAFVSWVMAAAGVDGDRFQPAHAHWIYLSRFLSDWPQDGAAFVPRTLAEYKPKPSDLICASRSERLAAAPDPLPSADQIANTKLHCDIVTAVKGRTLEAIGGNVRNSVSKSILQLSPQGHLQPTQSRQWFMIVENKLD